MFTAFVVGLCMTANVFLPGQVMAQVPSYVPTNGLIGWWPFNGNANDESGNNLNGNVIGAILTTDRFGNGNSAYDFNVSNWTWGSGGDRIFIPFSSLMNVPNLTVSAWFRRNTNGTMNQGMTVINRFQFGYSNPNGQTWGMSLDQNSSFLMNTWLLQAAPDNNQISLGNEGSYINADEWYNVAFTFDGISLKQYINGILIDSDLLPGFTLNTVGNSGISIGVSEQANGQWGPFGGQIDDIGFWNRALTPQEISDLNNVNSNCSNDLTISPSVNSIQTGNTANFSATTTDANASFIWQSDFGQGFQILNDFGNYFGTNTNALSISNVQLANHNQQIRAISSNTNCTDTSNIATIQIADTCITNVTVYDTLYTTVTDTLIINTTLSLPAPNNENTILIYPNPASDHITIDNGNYTAMAGYTIKIENNAGQQVFQSAINQAQFYVDLSTWTGNGLYFVHLIDPQNNTVTVRKIVLQ